MKKINSALVMTAVCVGLAFVNTSATATQSYAVEKLNAEKQLIVNKAIAFELGDQSSIPTHDEVFTFFKLLSKKNIGNLLKDNLSLSREMLDNLQNFSYIFTQDKKIIIDKSSRIQNLPKLISCLTDIQVLSLSDLNIDDLGIFNRMKSLENLTLDNNKITDLSPLANHVNLLRVRIFDNKVTDISPLKNSNKLESIMLVKTPVEDLSPLQDLNELKTIHLVQTAVKNISLLGNLKKLEYIVLEHSPIDDVSSLQDLPNLKQLYFTKIPAIDSEEKVEKVLALFPPHVQIAINGTAHKGTRSK